MVVSKKIFLALTADVKKEIKLTDEQDRKMKDLFGDSLRVDGEKFYLMMTPDLDLNQIEKDAIKLLDGDQTKRLTELWIQNLSGNAIASEEVGKELALTDDQKKKVERLIEEAGALLSELFMGGPDEESAKKAREITKKCGQKMIDSLTEEQKKKYEVMKGKEFKFKEIG